jgi:hypothetical protein
VVFDALETLESEFLGFSENVHAAIDFLRAASREDSLRGKFILTYGAIESIATRAKRDKESISFIDRCIVQLNDARLIAARKTSLRGAFESLKQQSLKDALFDFVDQLDWGNVSETEHQRNATKEELKKIIQLRNRLAHPSSAVLGNEFKVATEYIRKLVVQIIWSTSGNSAITFPEIKTNFEMSGMAIGPLPNSKFLWYPALAPK